MRIKPEAMVIENLFILLCCWGVCDKVVELRGVLVGGRKFDDEGPSDKCSMSQWGTKLIFCKRKTLSFSC